MQWSKSGSAAVAVAPSKAERRAEAKAKGYEGEMCSECGNFTLVRNGTCMKCRQEAKAKATKARCARSAATSRWCGMARA